MNAVCVEAFGARCIALLSDSHGVLAPSLLERLTRADLIVHAGDVGARSVVATLGAIAPLCMVAGNNDTPGQWPAGEGDDCAHLPQAMCIELHGGMLAVAHGHQFPKVATRHARLRAAFPAARVVVYGHSHRRCADLDAMPWVINPGASGKARAHGGAGGWLLRVTARDWSLEAL